MRINFSRTFAAIAVAAGLTLLNLGCSDPSKQANQPANTTPSDEPLAVIATVSPERNEAVATGIAIDKAARSSTNETSEFHAPFLLKADGEVIRVESPGYACPTMVDLDGDGKTDLVVGQFRNGNLMFFKNIADSDQTPQFAKGEWLMTASERAQVPGVS